MIRKLLFSASLGGLLLVGAPVMTHTTAQTPSQENPTKQSTKSVTGKVTTIGDQGRSFAVEVDNGGNKQTMQFVVDKNTQVAGQVRAGTVVTVDYQATNDGQNLCVRVAPQNS
jgi:hypothetical protein